MLSHEMIRQSQADFTLLAQQLLTIPNSFDNNMNCIENSNRKHERFSIVITTMKTNEQSYRIERFIL